MTIADELRAEGIEIGEQRGEKRGIKLGEKRGEKRGKEKWTVVGEIRFAQKMLKQPQTSEDDLFEQDIESLKEQLAGLEQQLV